MNGILARIGVEQLVLLFLALAAVLAVRLNLGGAFWLVWLLAVVGGLAASLWRRDRPLTGMD